MHATYRHLILVDYIAVQIMNSSLSNFRHSPATCSASHRSIHHRDPALKHPQSAFFLEREIPSFAHIKTPAKIVVTNILISMSLYT
jgi:hypothetical protein